MYIYDNDYFLDEDYLLDEYEEQLLENYIFNEKVEIFNKIKKTINAYNDALEKRKLIQDFYKSIFNDPIKLYPIYVKFCKERDSQPVNKNDFLTEINKYKNEQNKKNEMNKIIKNQLK